MTRTATLSPEHVFNIHKEIEIDAPASIVFEAILEQLGPGFDGPDGRPLQLKIEPWPGGRWYRDLGNNAGHLWGHVQVIKPPKLLEIWGPMAMSYAAINHVQFRLTEQDGGSHLAVTHGAMGDILPEHRDGMPEGWVHILNGIRERAEGRTGSHP
jgi:uncharacterized protein YndB with AHSA1/START domain